MKFNWKIIIAICTLVLLIACDKDTNNESTSNDNNNNENENGNENIATSVTIKPEDLPDAILEGSYQSIYDQTDDAFQAQVTLKELEDLGQDFNEDIDVYERVSELEIEGMKEYQWLSDNGTEGIRAYFADNNTIEGLQFMEVKSGEDTDDVWTENTYHMPNQGEWMTLWGGANELVNYHYAVESQRYAYDLLKMKDGYSYDGDASENESYFAYDEAVLAPLEGKVVATENDMEDNTPTVDTNEDEPFGNYVIIEHENSEYSVIGHMQEGSVSVKEGDTVETGKEIGKVGNSGNSSEPHIHFQVSDRPDLEESTSIRIQLKDEKEPVHGDTVTGFSKDDE